MAKKKDEKAGSGSVEINETTLAEMTREQLLQTAAGYELAFENASDEEIKKAILSAVEESKEQTGADPAQGSGDNNPSPSGDGTENKAPSIEENNGNGGNNSQPDLEDRGEILVTSKSRKGKKIIAASGTVITFDNEGQAKVRPEDALYLKNCPGFDVAD